MPTGSGLLVTWRGCWGWQPPSPQPSPSRARVKEATQSGSNSGPRAWVLGLAATLIPAFSLKGEGERAALVRWGALRVLTSGVGCLARKTPFLKARSERRVMRSETSRERDWEAARFRGRGELWHGHSWEAMVGGENRWLARPGWGSNRARLNCRVVAGCQGVGERTRRLRA